MLLILWENPNIVKGPREMPLPPWFFIGKKNTWLCKPILPYSYWFFKYLSLKVLILHFYTCLNCSLLWRVSHQMKLYFKNLLQFCTFLSWTLVTFVLMTWKYLASLIIASFLFLEQRYNCIAFRTEIQVNDSESQKLRRGMFLLDIKAD